MKHVLDQSVQAQSAAALRLAYENAIARRPSQAVLALQRRPAHRMTGAPMARQFLRIDRGHRA